MASRRVGAYQLYTQGWGRSMAIGASVHFLTLKEEFTKMKSVKYETVKSDASYSFGGTVAGKNAGAGVVVTPATRIVVDPSLGTAAGSSWFRDAVVPSLLVIGGYHRLNDKFLLAIDFAWYDIPTDVVDATSGFLPSNSTAGDVELNTGRIQVIHERFEWTLRS